MALSEFSEASPFTGVGANGALPSSHNQFLSVDLSHVLPAERIRQLRPRRHPQLKVQKVV